MYGDPASVPIRGDFPRGHTKLVIEDMLTAIAAAQPAWRVAILRYFNPVGAHESGWIGEAQSGVPNNLMPFVSQVALGKRPHLQVFGGDYPTPDGTGVRDYIHASDLVEGHLAALKALLESGKSLAVSGCPRNRPAASKSCCRTAGRPQSRTPDPSAVVKTGSPRAY